MRDGDRTLPTQRVEFAAETARRPGRLILRVLDGRKPGETIDVSGRVVSVGRSGLADVRVAHRSISSLHFELQARRSGAVLRDLGSTNGVWFQDRRVQVIELEAGDLFKAGECRFVLADVGEVEIDALSASRFGQLHGSSLAMRELYAQINSLAQTPLDILLLGETGTGKELTAHTIHEASRRRGPMIVLDCGALSPSLAEGTIFGFRKGAFTGAERDQAGVFEAAEGGTLFIDEVGELPLELQVKLLRALDRREVTRLGEPGHARKVDVRIVAATHRDLRQAVAEGSFREDLYYRLARAVLRTPPLREREQDTVELAQTFLGRVCQDYGLELYLGEDALRTIRAYRWPGNVRELRNAIEQAAHIKRRGAIGAAELRVGAGRAPRASALATGLEALLDGDWNYYEIHAELDKLLLPRKLEEQDHNLSRVSKRLGVSRDKLRTRLKELGLYSRSRS
ncbi:Nitric oxide reductase transcription regulator NorR2 [Enhygromyxa salina]|uniref:Nitric oxide reductase transcription regulator NorR2 n=1 Tax=Enhygromyxa salina TaxID=215803 RepID=A0A2S9XJT9_9BACT|nr:sigma 54-interacting transcriptional regulator [Enhygromyxa salina]PRP93134.1 Nitric oxide reductase transcription regulator NorR2 [Enhygromyxa salina]